MRVLHVQQNPKNPMKYSLYQMFRKRDPKVRYKDINEKDKINEKK